MKIPRIIYLEIMHERGLIWKLIYDFSGIAAYIIHHTARSIEQQHVQTMGMFRGDIGAMGGGKETSDEKLQRLQMRNNLRVSNEDQSQELQIFSPTPQPHPTKTALSRVCVELAQARISSIKSHIAFTWHKSPDPSVNSQQDSCSKLIAINCHHHSNHPCLNTPQQTIILSPIKKHSCHEYLLRKCPWNFTPRDENI